MLRNIDGLSCTNKQKFLSKKLTIAILSVSSLAVVGELFCKYILGLGTPPLSITHPTIEYLFKPNQNVRRFDNRIIINQYGMRSDNFLSQKQSTNDYRIMIFGDSVINGGNLTDHNNLATTIIQNKLQKSTDNPILVANISAGSWGPGNWLAYAKEYGFFGADRIILVISSHDYADNPSFKPLNPNTHPQKKPVFATQEAVTRYLPRFLSKIFEQINPPQEIDEIPKPNPEAIRQGLHDLEEFLSIAKNTNIDVSIIQYWDKAEVQTGNLQIGNQKIKQIAQKLDISVFQTGEIFQEAYQNREEPFRDNIHPNNKGQELLSEVMLKILQQ